MIRNFVFDFAETIATLSPSREDILIDFLASKGVSVQKRKVRQIYNNLDTLLSYSSVDIDNPSSRKSFYLEYNKKLFQMIGVSHLSKNIQSDYFNFFSGVEKHWVLKEGVRTLLKELKQNGLSISLISNFDSNLNEILEQLSLNDVFNHIVISQEAGLEKPDLTFYKYFLNISKYDLDKTIYIGDSYLLDYEPATEVGLLTYLLDENDFYPHLDNTFKSILDVRTVLN
jgi:FMN phosphatase YigB (HAD superfamily)